LGQTSSGIDFAFRASGRLSGTVRNALTAPVSGVTVQVFDASSGVLTTTAVTNSTGSYLLGVAAGTYFIRTSSGVGLIDQMYRIGESVACTGGLCLGSGTPVRLGTNDAMQIDFVLAGGGTITGTVRDATSGQPIANMSVLIQDGTHRGVASVQTN